MFKRCEVSHYSEWMYLGAMAAIVVFLGFREFLPICSYIRAKNFYVKELKISKYSKIIRNSATRLTIISALTMFSYCLRNISINRSKRNELLQMAKLLRKMEKRNENRSWKRWQNKGWARTQPSNFKVVYYCSQHYILFQYLYLFIRGSKIWWLVCLPKAYCQQPKFRFLTLRFSQEYVSSTWKFLFLAAGSLLLNKTGDLRRTTRKKNCEIN